MRTIALRFAENFAPDSGTIAAHQEVIDNLGYVWYGKMGCVVSSKVIKNIIQNDDLKILLIRSGKAERYWAHVAEIVTTVPELDAIPQYYRNMAGDFKTWFKITSFERAEKNVMSKCTVASSGALLCNTSLLSMSPYYIVDYNG